MLVVIDTQIWDNTAHWRHDIWHNDTRQIDTRSNVAHDAQKNIIESGAFDRTVNKTLCRG